MDEMSIELLGKLLKLSRRLNIMMGFPADKLAFCQFEQADYQRISAVMDILARMAAEIERQIPE